MAEALCDLGSNIHAMPLSTLRKMPRLEEKPTPIAILLE